MLSSSSNIQSRGASSSGSGRGGGRGGTGNTRRNTSLAAVAAETIRVLPGILQEIPHVNAAFSEEVDLTTLLPLASADCPGRPAVSVRVVNDDTINAALALAAAHPRADGPVALLNFANHRVAGGGWLKGARAQEEALCYRSSLHLSLHKRYYPFRSHSTCLYTPDMVIIRGDVASGHDLLPPAVHPLDLPVVSCISVAAIQRPPTSLVHKTILTPGGKTSVTHEVFRDPAHRESTKGKMRITLRIAAARGHGLLVLGALGCGAFGNPNREVAQCWYEVLREPEFAGGWWKDIVFAVYDPDARKNGNFDVFTEVLGGLQV